MIFKVLKFNSIRFWRKLVNVLFLLFFVFLVIGAQIHHANQKVKNVDILIDINIGDNFLAPSDIKNHILLKYDSVLGKRIGDVSLNEVENLVQNIVGVAKADAYFNTNGHLHIKVEQKKAICRVLTPDGKGYYIDDKGLIMPWVSVYTPNVFVCTGYISKYGKGLDSLKTNKDLNEGIFKLHQLLENNEFISQLISHFYIDKNGLKIPLSDHFTARVLVANGAILESFNNKIDTLQTKIAKDLFAVASYIEQDKLWSEQIVQIYINNENDMELVPRVGTQKIIFGNANDLESKFKNLMIFYKKAIPLVGWEAYSTINLKFKGQIVCVKRDSTLKSNKETPVLTDSTSINQEVQDSIKI